LKIYHKRKQKNISKTPSEAMGKNTQTRIKSSLPAWQVSDSENVESFDICVFYRVKQNYSSHSNAHHY
jgi:hypothetical protein